MSNHTFVTTRKHLTAARLEEALNDIAQRCFADRIQIVRVGESDWFKVIVPVADEDNQWRWEFDIWLATQRKVECLRPMNDFITWIMARVQNELAVRWSGWISGEGMSERWRGDASKFPTYRVWQDMLIENTYGSAKDVPPLRVEARNREYENALANVAKGWE